jgi:hypothetical protein
MLLVEVYAGQDGSFEMTEDDGVTLAYASDASKSTKTTVWEWNDTARQLSWRASGGGPPTYTSVRAHAKDAVHTIGAHVQLTWYCAIATMLAGQRGALHTQRRRITVWWNCSSTWGYRDHHVQDECLAKAI